MATFGLPDKDMLPESVQAVLPSDYDGVSKEVEIAKIFERFTPNHNISSKLRNVHAVSSSLAQIFEGLVETFPETGADVNDYWSLSIESYSDLTFWFRVYQEYGAILENGNFISIKDTLEVHRKYIQADSYLSFSVLERGMKFSKYVRDRGSYVSVKDTYPFLYRVDDEEALRLLSSGISLEEYGNYCDLGCFTYKEIFEGHVSELPSEWRDFLMEKLTGVRNDEGS